MMFVTLFTAIFWTLILLTVSCFGEEVCLDGCQVKPHIKCRISTVSCNTIDQNAEVSELWPSSPTGLTASPFVDTEQALGINFTWGLPNDASYQILTGFVLRIIDSDRLDGPMCVYFNLTGTNWEQSDFLNKVQFHYDCYSDVKYGREYFIQIQSVPFDLSPSMDYLHVQAPSHFVNPPDGRYWSTFITIKEQISETCCPDVEITFTYSPFHPLEYLVTLVINSTSRKTESVLHFATENKGNVTIPNVCADSYKVQIEQDEKTGDGACVCGEASWVNCYPCPVTELQHDRQIHKIPCDEPGDSLQLTTKAMSEKIIRKREDEVPLGVFVGLFAFAAIFLSVVMVTLIYCVWTRQKNSQYNVEVNNNSLASTSLGIQSPLNTSLFDDGDTLYMQRQLEQQSLDAMITNNCETQSPSTGQSTEVFQNRGISTNHPDGRKISDKDIVISGYAF